MNVLLATKVFAKAWQNNVTSAKCYYRQPFQLDIHYSAFVHIFNISFSNGHLYRAERTMNSMPSQIPERWTEMAASLVVLLRKQLLWLATKTRPA
ncbi:MAG: hypothetical protein JST17_12240 [Bacteroidetes bacterium]|nr:hypothetical protein [Bacteroidota bacterium]